MTVLISLGFISFFVMFGLGFIFILILDYAPGAFILVTIGAIICGMFLVLEFNNKPKNKNSKIDNYF